MNERIKELANQLGPVATIGNWGRIEWADNVYPQLGDKMYAAIDLQKFAELIVKECIKLNSKELSITAIERLLPLYEEHFGVEE
jgi:hypothetical protein